MDFDLSLEPFSLVPLGLDRRQLQILVREVTQFINMRHPDLEVLVCGDRRIAELNEQFLGCPGPTNVLSFPDGLGGGQVVISSFAVLREATLYGREAPEHFIRLLVHGLLHLTGFEHGPEMFDFTELAVQRSLQGLSRPERDLSLC